MLKKIIFLSIILSFLISILSACSYQYTVKYFSFPPDSKPYDRNCKYIAKIVIGAKNGAIVEKNNKKVTLQIFDMNEDLLLDCKYEFIAASINARVTWENFEEFNVELFEEGYLNYDWYDPYNAKLIKDGPKNLFKSTYHYDSKIKKYIEKNRVTH